MANGTSAMQVFAGLGKALGLATKLESIFGGGDAPIAGEIAALVVAEVERIFFEQGAETLLRSSAAEIDTVRMFLGIDYLNLKKHEAPPAELWSLLNQPSSPSIADLQKAQSELNFWLNMNKDRPPSGAGSYIERAASVGIGLATHICLLHRERAAVAPSGTIQAAELQNMHDKARYAIAQFQPAVEDALHGRIGRLLKRTGDWGDGPKYYQTTIRDNWNQDPNELWVTTTHAGHNVDPNKVFANQARVMDPLFALYPKVLWAARSGDCDAFRSGLPMKTFAPDYDFTNGDVFVNNLENIFAFGKWASEARVALMGLDLTASALTAQQADDWHICGNCAALFHGIDDRPCPAGGVHSYWATPNLVLHQPPSDTTGWSAPPNAESNWAECTRCTGLFRTGGASACSADGGAPHVAGASHFMCYGDVPDASHRGIPNAQTNFFHCANCGLLCFPPNERLGPLGLMGGGSVCPAGGAHVPDLGRNYWTSWIAIWEGGFQVWLFPDDVTVTPHLSTPSTLPTPEA